MRVRLGGAAPRGGGSDDPVVAGLGHHVDLEGLARDVAVGVGAPAAAVVAARAQLGGDGAGLLEAENEVLMPPVCARQLFSTTRLYLGVVKYGLRLGHARPTPPPRLPVRRRERLGAGRRRQPGADLLGRQPAPVGPAARDRADPVPAGRPRHRAHRGGPGARRPERRGDEPVEPARPGGHRPARRAFGPAVDRLLLLRGRRLDAVARQAADRRVPRPRARAGAQRGRAEGAAAGHRPGHRPAGRPAAERLHPHRAHRGPVRGDRAARPPARRRRHDRAHRPARRDLGEQRLPEGVRPPPRRRRVQRRRLPAAVQRAGPGPLHGDRLRRRGHRGLGAARPRGAQPAGDGRAARPRGTDAGAPPGRRRARPRCAEPARRAGGGAAQGAHRPPELGVARGRASARATDQ